jgi:hypothetical protein
VLHIPEFAKIKGKTIGSLLHPPDSAREISDQEELNRVLATESLSEVTISRKGFTSALQI